MAVLPFRVMAMLLTRSVTAAGAFSKPFLLPLKHPSEHRRRMKSYNIPEFSAGPVAESPAELHGLTKSKPRKAAISR